MDDSAHRPPPPPDVTDTQWDSVETHEVVHYSPETDTYRTSFDVTNGSVCTAIVSTVAAVSEAHPTELPPLYSACEVDELERLLAPTGTEPSSSGTCISFTYNDCAVTVYDYGIIAVQPPEDFDA